MKHIIFDFDGVLSDSFHFHLDKINTHFNIGLTDNEYRDMHNGNFYSAPLEKMKKFGKEKYPDLVAEEQSQLPFLPQARKALENFRTKHGLHIISSGWERQIRPFLQYHKIEDYFSEILCADHGVLKSDKFKDLFKSQNVEPDNCIFITDTLGDILEARAVGVDTIAVTFGFQPKESLEKGSPAYLANSWSEVENIIEKYF
jgi:phosphoglycolate phosphatase